jgi:putative peptidoglycan lipid II flippase
VIAAGLYQGGAFTGESARWVWGALAGAAVGLLANTMGRLYSSASYALGDTRGPLRFAVARVAIAAALGWGAALWLPPLLDVDDRWGVAAITAASGIAAWVEFTLLRHSVSRRIGRTGVPATRLAALWACALVPGAAAFATATLLAERPPSVIAAGALTVFGLGYLGATRALRVDDARRS